MRTPCRPDGRPWRGRGCRRPRRRCSRRCSASGGSAGSAHGSATAPTRRCPRWAAPAGTSRSSLRRRGCRPRRRGRRRASRSRRGSPRAPPRRRLRRAVEEVTMSPSTSTARGRSSSRTRAWKQVYSFAVKAFTSPPTSSSSTEMSSAERDGVPLNSRCSRKCEAPESAGTSSRDPTPIQTPMAAEWTPGIASVTTRRPPGRTVRRTGARPSLADSSVRVVPGCCAEAGPVMVWAMVCRTPTPPTLPRRPGPARACRGRRSRRSRPGSSGRPRRRPRRPRRACRRPGRAAC